jgi:YD repeat-containing protein
MKTQIKFAVLIIVLCFIQTNLLGQTTVGTKLQYTYDANGNRSTRSILTVSLLSKFNPDDTINHKKETSSDKAQSTFNVIIGPNPTSNNIIIELQSNSNTVNTVINEFEYTITSSSGAILLSNKVNAKTGIIDLSGFKDGLYLLSLTTNNKTNIYKIVKANF